jgi:hypothetical protein
VGFNLFRNVKLSYAFEFPPNDLNTVRGGSHELMFSFNFGSKKQPEIISENIEETEIDKELVENTEEIRNQEKVEEEARQKAVAAAEKQKQDSILASKNTVESDVEITEDRHMPQDSVVAEIPTNQPVENKVIDEIREIDGVPVLSKGYYVITGVFNYRGNAERFIAESATKGFQFKLAFNPKSDLFYVYKVHTDNLLEARYSRSIYAKIKQFSDVWIYKGE